MADGLVAQVWSGRLIYFLCAGFLLFLSLVPLGFTPRFLPRPDLLLGLTFAFMLRRPDFTPFWLIAIIFLLSDILLAQPVGLWTAIMVVTAEFVRTQEYRFRELAFPLEWLFVTGTIFLALLANRIILSMSMVPVAGFGSVMLHFIVTVIAYPVVVFLCFFLLRIRKITPDEAIRYGHRL